MKNNKTRTEYSMLNIIVGMGGYILNTLTAFACRMVFARCLSTEYLGLSSLISNFLSILSLSELGIGSAIVYALYKPIAENNQRKLASYMHSYRKAYRIIGITVAGMGLAALPFLRLIIGERHDIQENIYLIYGMSLFPTVVGYFFSYRVSLLIAHQRQYIVSGVSYILSIAASLLQIVILLTTGRYILYLAVNLASSIINIIIIYAITDKEYPFLREKDADPLSEEDRHSLFKNVKRITVYKLSGVLVNNTDNLVLTYFTGLNITGLASNYTLLANTLVSLVNQVFNSLTASVGNLNATDNVDKQYAFFNSLNLANFWIFGWASIGIAFVSSDLISLLFGANYVMAFRISLILAVNVYMRGMQNAIWTFKNTKGFFQYGQYILLVTAALNIIGDIVLGKRYGVFGIYLATALARLFTNTWYEPYAVFKVAFRKNPMIYFFRYARFTALLVGTGALCGWLCSFAHFSVPVNVITKVLICSLIPNGIFYVLFRQKVEFIYMKMLLSNGLKIMKARLNTKNG